jgi:hypothetical protein
VVTWGYGDQGEPRGVNELGPAQLLRIVEMADRVVSATAAEISPRPPLQKGDGGFAVRCSCARTSQLFTRSPIGAKMRKLSEYVEMAAAEYLQETGKTELDPLWIAEFFQDSGLQDNYPRQDLVAFCALVQKVLTKKSERAGKQTRMQLEKIIHLVKHPRKP